MQTKCIPKCSLNVFDGGPGRGKCTLRGGAFVALNMCCYIMSIIVYILGKGITRRIHLLCEKCFGPRIGFNGGKL